MRKYYLKTILILCIVFLGNSSIKNRGGIVLSFDDDYYNSWHEIIDTLKKYDAKATFFLTRVKKLYENVHGTYADSLKILYKLHNNGNEIACHGWEHRTSDSIGIENFPYIDEEMYMDSIVLRALYSMRKLGFNPVCFAYPHGARNHYKNRTEFADIDTKILRHFKFVRGTNSIGIPLKANNRIYHSYSRLAFGAGLDVFYNEEQTSLESIKGGLERAENNNEIIVLYAHNIVDNPVSGRVQVSRSKIATVIRLADSLNLKFYTMSELPMWDCDTTLQFSVNDGFQTGDIAIGHFNCSWKDSFFKTENGQWLISLHGTDPWWPINNSTKDISNIKFGDFNGDGMADAFTTSFDQFGNRIWMVSFSCRNKWRIINRSDFSLNNIFIGDFNGDGISDFKIKP